MFKFLFLDDSIAICAIIAFATAAAIFLFFAWRALCMSRTQIDHFSNLPFADSGESGLTPDPLDAHRG